MNLSYLSCKNDGLNKRLKWDCVCTILSANLKKKLCKTKEYYSVIEGYGK